MKAIRTIIEQTIHPAPNEPDGDIEFQVILDGFIKRISINFCGGCNPQINRLEIAQAVEKLLSVSGINVIYNNFDTDFIKTRHLRLS